MVSALPSVASPKALATWAAEPRFQRVRHVLHYGAQLAAHGVARVALRPWMRRECRPQGRACARDFFALSYRHHVRGADTPPCCRRRIHAILAQVGAALDAARVPWFAFWGTFLGAVRHADLIPWDRDADVVVSARDRARALAALAGLGHALRPGLGGADDVVRVAASARNHVGVDVEFWHEEGDDLVAGDGAGAVRVRSSEVFPLVRRRFGALQLPTPHSTRLLESLYGEDCLTRGVRTEQRFGCPNVPILSAPRP